MTTLGLFPGSGHSPEGGAVRLAGDTDVGAHEEHGSVRRIWTQSLHEGGKAPLTDDRFLTPLTWFLVFQGLGTDEETLIEIICSRNNEELMEIKQFYRESNNFIRSKI